MENNQETIKEENAEDFNPMHHIQNYVVFIIDGVVQQIFGADERFASILLSSPTVVDITDRDDRGNIQHGATYDEDRDRFINPQPYPSWSWNDDISRWEAPTPRPTDIDGDILWSEPDQEWVVIPKDDFAL